MNDEIEILEQRIRTARAYAQKVFKTRAHIAGVLGGAPGLIGYEITFPDPDIVHVHQLMLGRRVGEPVVFRLSFGRQLKWVCVKHPWGLKAADVVVPE